jgi:hypothetical protein
MPRRRLQNSRRRIPPLPCRRGPPPTSRLPVNSVGGILQHSFGNDALFLSRARPCRHSWPPPRHRLLARLARPPPGWPRRYAGPRPVPPALATLSEDSADAVSARVGPDRNAERSHKAPPAACRRRCKTHPPRDVEAAASALRTTFTRPVDYRSGATRLSEKQRREHRSKRK